MTPLRASTYAELRAAIAERRRALGWTQEVANDAANLQGGYWNKLEAGLRHFGDMSLDRVLSALGCQIVLMPAVRTHEPPAVENGGPQADWRHKVKLTAQQKGGIARASKLTPKKRSESASKAARTRWKRHFAGRPRECKPKKPDAKSALGESRGAEEG